MAGIGGFPMIGRTLGHYRITEKIGQGGMGEVYRARDERLDRDVAIKVLPSGTVAGEDARKRFRREALTLSKLSHPFIATIFEFGTQDGTDFLVMEYVAGDTLKEKLQAGPLPEKDIAKLGGEIAEALEEAHEHGIIHRDLKPGNIALTPKGHVKVLDFGIAKLLRSEEDDAEAPTVDTLTKTVGRAGTLPYMAPEQLRGEEIDAHTDIYALGATLYEAATGRRPFDAPTAEVLIGDIQHKSPRPPRELNSRITEAFGRIILKCLDKDPALRYQSARELHVDLGRLGRPAPVIEKRTSMTRRLLGYAGALALLLALLVGLNVAGLRDRLFGGGPIDSIAVLPFENMMGDAEQDYFVEGMHEALITELSKIGALTVIARTSVLRYRDSDTPVREIARDLNVDAVIEGSVLRAGDMVRVTAQLIDSRTEGNLWAESFDRELTDILALHSDVARAIAGQIKIAVTPAEESRLAATRPVNPAAYEAYLKGRFHFNRFTEEDLKKSFNYFEQAINIDPSYALAYAGLGDTYLWRGFGFAPLPPREAYAKGKAAVAKALELDNTLAEAHASLGFIKDFYDWDWTGAEREFRRAIDLSPSYAPAHARYAFTLALMGRFDEALAEIQRAQELEPLGLLESAQVAWIYYWSGQFDPAIEQLRKVLELDPNFAVAHYNLGFMYSRQGRHEEAIAAGRKAIELGGESAMFLAVLGKIYARAGKRDEALKIVVQLNERSQREYVPRFPLAGIYLGLGEKEQALAWLEKAYEEREGWLTNLKRESFEWDPLHDDPRFQDLLRRMNFPSR